jgi:hypothetical protein
LPHKELSGLFGASVGVGWVRLAGWWELMVVGGWGDHQVTGGAVLPGREGSRRRWSWCGCG